MWKLLIPKCIGVMNCNLVFFPPGAGIGLEGSAHHRQVLKYETFIGWLMLKNKIKRKMDGDSFQIQL